MAKYRVTIKNSDETLLGGIGARELAMTNVDESVAEYTRLLNDELEALEYDAEYIFEYGPFSGRSIVVEFNDLPWCAEDVEMSEQLSDTVQSVGERVFENATFWVAYKNPEVAARARIDKLGLDGDEDIIFSDWPNWDQHMEWLLTASVDEILDWISNAC